MGPSSDIVTGESWLHHPESTSQVLGLEVFMTTPNIKHYLWLLVEYSLTISDIPPSRNYYNIYAPWTASQNRWYNHNISLKMYKIYIVYKAHAYTNNVLYSRTLKWLGKKGVKSYYSYTMDHTSHFSWCSPPSHQLLHPQQAAACVLSSHHLVSLPEALMIH